MIFVPPSAAEWRFYMTVKELYDKMSLHIPESLSEEWDNDGLMCSSDTSLEVKRVLLALDVTEEIVDYAIERSYDLIISHHPIIFRPVSKINAENHIARKIIKLINNDISVFSFHTRLDKVNGGVNDILARLLGLTEITAFGDDGLGRVGNLPCERELDEFCDTVKTAIGAVGIRVADGYNSVKRVALVGGDGKDYVRDAIAANADTYVSGRISYNIMEEAPELGINLIEAGHYYTEAPVLNYLAELVTSCDMTLSVDIANSNMIEIV